MTLKHEIDEFMNYSRSIAEVAESESDEANRMSAEYFADYYKQIAEWLSELKERRKYDNCEGCYYDIGRRTEICETCKRLYTDNYDAGVRSDG